MLLEGERERLLDQDWLDPLEPLEGDLDGLLNFFSLSSANFLVNSSAIFS